jgi:hypothetical protein
VRSVDSNLETKNGPGLNVNFRSIEVPKISIMIDGQETELDTSRLKDEVLKRKNFLAQKLLSFAADFIASDVAEMLNVYLVTKEIATSYEVYRKDNLVKFDEFLSHHQDRVENKVFERSEFSLAGTDPGTAMIAQISEIIKNAQIKISLRKISTPGTKDIELSGLLNFILNNRQIVVKNTLGNSNRPLPALDLSAQRNFDINLAISEPLINGALDLANSTGLFQEIFEKLAPVPGVSIQSIKLHFAATGTLVAVVNTQVDLNKLESKGIKSWFKRRIAAWLERNNNNSIIYFPIEVSINPLFKKTEKGMELELRILSPFLGGALNNRFKYPSNVPKMTDTVKDGVMDELKASLEPHTNKSYKVDVTKFLNQSGVVFQPKSFAISQDAYLMMNLDIVDIKFNSKNSGK